MKSKKKPKQTLLKKAVAIHVCCWLVFIAYELVLLLYMYKKLEPANVYIRSYCINILLFYGQSSLLNHVFNHQKPKYFKGLLLFLMLLAAYLLAKFALSYLFQTMGTPFGRYFQSFIKFLPTTLFRVGYFTILATFYWAAGHISVYRKQAAASERQQLLALKENAELETRLAESRNAYLKQQVSPHLLFNTLNFIYSSVYEYSSDASHCIILLSDIMRFSLEETGPDGKVPLNEEVQQLSSLVEINRYRYDTQLAISIQLEGEFERYRVIPLILLTLTENLFKHGNLLDMAHPAMLRLEVAVDGRLTYYCRNLKKSKSDYTRTQQIGLQNVRVRLDFAYPEKYDLSVSETEKFYELTLNLHL